MPRNNTGIKAPTAPADVDFVVHSSRSSSGEPAKGPEAAELLSKFFDEIEEDDDTQDLTKPGARDAQVAARTQQLNALVAGVRTVIGQPLEYTVVHAPLVQIREEPSTLAACVGRLKYGATVRGIPAGRWLYLDTEEVNRLQKRGLPESSKGAWVLIEGPHKRSLLAPQWASLAAHSRAGGALELSWPGFPEANATYTVQWRPLSGNDKDVKANQADQVICQERRALVQALSADADMQVRVVVRISGAQKSDLVVDLAGAWGDVSAAMRRGEEEQQQTPRQEEQNQEPQQAESEAPQSQGFCPAATTDVAKYESGEVIIKKKPVFDPLFDDGTKKSIFGSYSLPERYAQIETLDLSNASIWAIYSAPVNLCQIGPELPEDPRCRCYMVHCKPPVILIELHAVASFNMMDPDLSNDLVFGMDSIMCMYKMPHKVKNCPNAYVVQGSGPHFCPGGNPNPGFTPGHTPATTTQYTGYLPFIRCREWNISGLTALHGSMVGGGVAYSLNTAMRIGTTTLSVSYGNASRGAVPGMQLSRNVPDTLGFAGGMSLYLCDSTLSSFACVKGSFLAHVCGGIPQMKTAGYKFARKFAATPTSYKVPQLRPPADMHRFADEAVGINLSAKSGVMFASLKQAKRKSQPKKVVEEAPEAVEEYQPKRRPKRRPRR
jgi:enoyl-CoA hydratase/carnithine racemase